MELDRTSMAPLTSHPDNLEEWICKKSWCCEQFREQGKPVSWVLLQ